MSLKIRSMIAICFGAIAGGLSRYYIIELAKNIFGKDFGYYGTFIVNMLGCIFIAYIFTVVIEKIKNFPFEIKLLLTTGFCGSFTTFSGFTLENYIFLDTSQQQLAFYYWFGSIIISLWAIYLGIKLARLTELLTK